MRYKQRYNFRKRRKLFKLTTAKHVPNAVMVNVSVVTLSPTNFVTD
jgi:hypothetical protein